MNQFFSQVYGLTTGSMARLEHEPRAFHVQALGVYLKSDGSVRLSAHGRLMPLACTPSRGQARSVVAAYLQNAFEGAV